MIIIFYFLFFFLLNFSSSFYLPGVAPRDYETGEQIDMKVMKIDSIKTHLPYSYYTLPFCEPDKVQKKSENIGEVLAGDVIETLPYDISMKIAEKCKILCRQSYSAKNLDKFKKFINDDYKIYWSVDNLPATTKFYSFNQIEERYDTFYEQGFHIGHVGGVDTEAHSHDQNNQQKLEQGHIYLNNHVRFYLYYHQAETDTYDFQYSKGARVVGFEIEPFR